jgi:hypothetical protein
MAVCSGLMELTNGAPGIAAEFPGWEAWQGIDRLWHARIRGAVPPVMVHGEDLVDLRDQIIRFIDLQQPGTPGGD